jgi:hypothetical protein
LSFTPFGIDIGFLPILDINQPRVAQTLVCCS